MSVLGTAVMANFDAVQHHCEESQVRTKTTFCNSHTPSQAVRVSFWDGCKTNNQMRRQPSQPGFLFIYIGFFENLFSM